MIDEESDCNIFVSSAVFLSDSSFAASFSFSCSALESVSLCGDQSEREGLI